jgi:hypothetical protein
MDKVQKPSISVRIWCFNSSMITKRKIRNQTLFLRFHETYFGAKINLLQPIEIAKSRVSNKLDIFDVSVELRASFNGVTRICELGTIAVVTVSVVPSSQILVTLMKEALSSSETSVLTRSTRRNIPEGAILHSHRRENPQILYRYIPLINSFINRFYLKFIPPQEDSITKGLILLVLSCLGRMSHYFQ